MAAVHVSVAELRPLSVMLAAPIQTLPGPVAFRGLSAEPKYDGYRALLLRYEGRCLVQSRRGTDLTRAFPDLAATALEQLPDETVLDGEAVVGVDGRLDFSQLQRRIAAAGRASAAAREAPATFLAFDLLVLRGEDLRERPLAQRRDRLAGLMQDCWPPLQQVPYTLNHDQAADWFEAYGQARVGIEGLVLKRVDEPYLARQRRWRKLRYRETAEVLVGAVTGTLARPDRLILALPDPSMPGGLIIAGGTSALGPAQSRELAALLRPATDHHPWPTVLPAGRSGVWGRDPLELTLVDPTLVVEVLADTAHQHGHWRHVVRYVRPRPDLTATELQARNRIL